jgi:hypothetical protein
VFAGETLPDILPGCDHDLACNLLAQPFLDYQDQLFEKIDKTRSADIARECENRIEQIDNLLESGNLVPAQPAGCTS